MKVQATRRGYYDVTVREVGDVFVLIANESQTVEEQFTESWMESVPEETPERVTSSQEALLRENEQRSRRA